MVYNVTVSEGDAADSGTWTFAQDPPREALILDFDDGGKVYLLTDGSESFICFEAAGFGQCLPHDAATGSPIPPGTNPNESIANARAAPSVTELDARTIAGRNARCFAYDGESAGVTCLDEEAGIPLAMEFDGTTMTATSVTEPPGAALFEPPFELPE